jgi:hypothetical protein
MAEFQYLDGGNSEIQDMQAEAFLYASSGTTGIAASGVIEGLVVTQTGTASGSVLIAAGACINQASLGQGASRLINPSQKTLDIFTANPVGGLPRNDIVVFDSVTKLITVIVGTPNATPTDPTVPATSVKLARLRNLASATTIPTAQIDNLIVATTLRGAVNPPGSATPTGPVVTWATATSGYVATGTTIISPVTLPAVGCATRVYIQAEGAAGFNSVGIDVGLSISGSQAVTQTPTTPLVRAVAALYTRVTQSGYMDIPANTSATVSLAGLSQFGGNSAYFVVSMTLTRVNT